MTQQGKLDEAVSKEDQEILLQALQSWGALDSDYAYNANLISADFRGYAQRSRRRTSAPSRCRAIRSTCPTS